MNELSTWSNRGCFITLTYNKENLPEDNSLHKEHLQKFFKRLRKSLGDKKIKYFACGEYGEKKKRPHYHAIVFGLSVMEAMEQLPLTWKLGFFDIQPVYFESCKYVTGYVMKKYNGEKAKQEYGDRQIPFRLSSLGLGKEFALNNRDNLIENGGYLYRGFNQGLPKYYKLLFDREDVRDIVHKYKNLPKNMETWTLCRDEVRYFVREESLARTMRDKAIRQSEEEKEEYKKFLEKFNPDLIVDNDSLVYENWKRSIDKLRDLTIKAKNRLKEKKL